MQGWALGAFLPCAWNSPGSCRAGIGPARLSEAGADSWGSWSPQDEGSGAQCDGAGHFLMLSFLSLLCCCVRCCVPGKGEGKS